MLNKIWPKRIAIMLSVFMLASCETVAVYDKLGGDMINSSGVYTLVNLHPDIRRSRLYAINYQGGDLIPLCTEVTLLKASKNVLKFEVISTGQRYTYRNHKAAVEPLAAHLSNFFGRKCNTSKVERLSSIDQKGIREGVAYEGMSRNGIILAMGYPPRHKTPDLMASRWVYWKDRRRLIVVKFGEDGLVNRIED